ncbi:Wzz/FepE/Etk N-terminal domain-containing protein [Rhodovibrio salinarum]|nr:Wzz/FepE/Etk N-terminal domain-containing protein [Rhodovibrio salinarum]
MADDEISLFDVWNVLVRRRWIVLTVFALALVTSVIVVVMRPTTYRLSQTIEIGDVEVGPVSDLNNLLGRLQEEERVANELENLYIPAVQGELTESNELQTNLDPSISAQAVDNTRLVRMNVEVSEPYVSAYEQLMSNATDRLIAAHDAAQESVRHRLQYLVVEAQNEAANIRDLLETRQNEFNRVSVEEVLIEEEIEDIQELIKRTDAARLEVFGGQPNVSQAMSIMLIANELRRARQDLSALRKRRKIALPAQRDEIQDEIASLERRLEVAEGKAEVLETRMAEFTGTSVVVPLKRSDKPTGTPWPVICVLGGILGLVAGILAAFFAEFVSAARAYRPARS